jgi:tRNA A37 threonylcarbamoyladenosine biosynthesis protein TsaE
MSLKIYQGEKFKTTHENKIFDDLIDKLDAEWGVEKNEDIFLIGNFFCNNQEIDACVIKRDSISVIDFKDYGGKIFFSENGDWTTDLKISIKGGSSSNPYKQIKKNKFALLNFLEDKKNEIFKINNEVNLGHISGIAIFHQKIIFDDSQLPGSVKPWFYVCDINHAIRLFKQITSKNINLSIDEIKNIVKSLRVNDYVRDKAKVSMKVGEYSYHKKIEENKQYTKQQKEALQRISVFINNEDEKVFILNGAAGTGKSYTIKGIVDILNEQEISYRIMAPTGRAVNMIANKINCSVSTVHSQIYEFNEREVNVDIEEKDNLEEESAIKIKFGLRKNKDSDNMIYIIDEASMLNNEYRKEEFLIFGSGQILGDLIEYTNLKKNKRKFIFIGDNMQITGLDNDNTSALNRYYLKDNFGLVANNYELTEVLRQKKDSPILINAMKIRESVIDKKFNRFVLDYDDDSIFKLDNEDNFIDYYKKVIRDKPSLDSIIICFTNKEVKKYNDLIRKGVFKYENIIQQNDVVMLYKSFRYLDDEGVYNYRNIPNGEIGEIIFVENELEIINQVIKIKGGSKNVELKFREVHIRFFDKIIESLIFENFLDSDKTHVSDEELRALLVLAQENYKKKKGKLPKRQSGEYTELLMNDKHFNALLIKYGYAITGHKAQGGEWKDVFVDFYREGGIANESFFKWAYTCLTRPIEKLYALNAPQITSTSKIKWKDNESAVGKIINPITLVEINEEFPEPFLKKLNNKYKIIFEKKGIELLIINHAPYCEKYGCKQGEEMAVLNIYYNKEDFITRIYPEKATTQEFLDEIKNILI